MVPNTENIYSAAAFYVNDVYIPTWSWRLFWQISVEFLGFVISNFVYKVQFY